MSDDALTVANLATVMTILRATGKPEGMTANEIAAQHALGPSVVSSGLSLGITLGWITRGQYQRYRLLNNGHRAWTKRELYRRASLRNRTGTESA